MPCSDHIIVVSGLLKWGEVNVSIEEEYIRKPYRVLLNSVKQSKYKRLRTDILALPLASNILLVVLHQ